MEIGPPKPAAAEQTPFDDKKESKKSKKKDAEKLGAFAVESRPSLPRQKAVSLGERLVGSAKDDKAERLSTKDDLALSDKAPELNGEAPLEHLSEVETRAATQELARNRQAELASELTDTAADDPTIDQVEAAAAFAAKTEITGDAEAAFTEVMAEFEVETNQETDATAPEDDLATTELQSGSIERVIDPHQSAEGDLPLHADEAAAGGTSPPRRPTFGWAAGQPPLPGGESYNSYNAPRAASSETTASPTISTEKADYYERRAQLRGLLVGGIVGYLIGRRRGRIKAEKRLLPVQNKLEKEVQTLQINLLEKEIIIRRAAAEQRRVALSPASEQLVTTTAEYKRTAVAERQPGADSLPPERIGHVLMTSERGSVVPESNVKMQPDIEKRSIENQVATMPRAGLLAVCEKITVEGTTLRQIYETHLVGERGLRRLVTEHLSGGDVQRALRRELVEREIDFERDPILRDRARASLAGAGKGALNSLVQQAGAVAVMPDYVAPAYQAPEQPDTNHDKLAPKHRLAGIVLVSTIAVLVAIIIFLLATGQ